MNDEFTPRIEQIEPELKVVEQLLQEKTELRLDDKFLFDPTFTGTQFIIPKRAFARFSYDVFVDYRDSNHKEGESLGDVGLSYDSLEDYLKEVGASV
ncbi:hypothetical protein KDA11_02245 [Candidatus Saccharibacteria bacterium]|nr:hypothetical protein [Candidatus Saccharibacteria bacterium]